MKKLLSFFILTGFMFSAGLFAAEAGSSGSGSSSGSGASSSGGAASSSSSTVDLSKTTATIVTPDGTVELKVPVLLNVAGGSIELSPLHVWVLKSELINGMLFEMAGELKEPLDFSKIMTLEAAQVIATILDIAVRAGTGEDVLKGAIEQEITAENALSVIYALTYLDSPLAGQIMQFVLDTNKMNTPKNDNEKYAVLSHEEVVKQAHGAMLMPFWVQNKCFGNDGWILSVAYSPDGKHIASAGNTVRIWDAINGKLELKLAGHTDLVTSVAFSPDGKHIASGSDDNTIRIWDATTGKVGQILVAPTGRVLSVAYSPDGKHIASGSDDNTVRIWDAVTGKEEQTLARHTDLFNSVAYSPDGKYIVSGGDDNTVRIWDAATGKEEQALVAPTGRVLSVAYLPDGKHIVTGNDDHTVRIWDAINGKLVRTFTDSPTFAPWFAACSPDCKHITSSGFEDKVRIWGLADELSSLDVFGQWQMLVENARTPFKDCMDAVLYATMSKDLKRVGHRAPTHVSACFLARPVLLASARHYKSVFRLISDLMIQHAPADVVQRFFETHKSAFGERSDEVAADVARYTQEFLRERWAERFDGASSSKDS